MSFEDILGKDKKIGKTLKRSGQESRKSDVGWVTDNVNKEEVWRTTDNVNKEEVWRTTYPEQSDEDRSKGEEPKDFDDMDYVDLDSWDDIDDIDTFDDDMDDDMDYDL